MSKCMNIIKMSMNTKYMNIVNLYMSKKQKFLVILALFD